MSIALPDYSEARIGQTWTAEDHAHLVEELRKVDSTVTACVRKVLAAATVDLNGLPTPRDGEAFQ